MSSYDDDEALFEDIYGDDDQSAVKPTTNDSTKPVGSNELSDDESKSASENTKSEDKQGSESSSTSVSAGTQDQNTPSSIPSIPVSAPSVPSVPAIPTGSNNGAATDFLQGIPPHLQQQFQQFQQQQQYLQQQQQQQQSQQNLPPAGLPPAPVSQPQMPPPPPQQQAPSEMGRGTGKMFIGGLNWDTTEEKLVAYFSQYGKVTDHTIMRDGNTGRSRGFGFLTFENSSSVDEVIKTDHVLDGKLIDPKRAIAREEQDKVGKIFIGGIDPMVNEKEFDEFFSQFGHIIDCQLMIDKDTGRSRGFGFITYDSPEAVDKVTVNKYLTLKGKAMEVKRAEPRGQHQQNQAQQQQQQQPQVQYNAYGSPYGASQYGQTQMAGAPAAASPYGQQSMNGMSPEMMQEYWQRMQQWYLYQGQQQAANGATGGEQGQEGEAADNQTEQPEQQPLNPQQQAPIEPQEPEDSGDKYGNSDSNNYGGNNSYGSNSDYGSNSGYGNQGGNSGGYGYRGKYNGGGGAPRGPRRTPPSGPSRGRGGYQNRNRGGYHPYGRGGRR